MLLGYPLLGHGLHGTRVFGRWGLAYSSARWQDEPLGFIRWYGRGGDDKVLVDTARGRYLLEPERPDEFVAAIEAARSAPIVSSK
jgi:hypothetical protein